MTAAQRKPAFSDPSASHGLLTGSDQVRLAGALPESAFVAIADVPPSSNGGGHGHVVALLTSLSMLGLAFDNCARQNGGSYLVTFGATPEQLDRIAGKMGQAASVRFDWPLSVRRPDGTRQPVVLD